MSIEYIKKKKLCPFMSDSNGRVYCTEECALVVTHHDPDTDKVIGVTCGAFSFEETLEDISQKLEVLIETR